MNVTLLLSGELLWASSSAATMPEKLMPENLPQTIDAHVPNFECLDENYGLLKKEEDVPIILAANF